MELNALNEHIRESKLKFKLNTFVCHECYCEINKLKNQKIHSFFKCNKYLALVYASYLFSFISLRFHVNL